MYSSTISNAESPLLLLPQELKDRIYRLVYSYGGTVIRFSHYNYSDSIRMRVYDDINSSRCRHSVPMASLRTCRQIYHDAKDAYYSTNEFQINYVKDLGMFIQHLDYVSHRALAVRRLDLSVDACGEIQERKCDNEFRALVQSLKNLRHVSIWMWVGTTHMHVQTRLDSLAYRKEPLLPGLLEFKKLPLRTFTLAVAEYSAEYWKERYEYPWTAVQKQEWVQYVKGAVLGSD